MKKKQRVVEAMTSENITMAELLLHLKQSSSSFPLPPPTTTTTATTGKQQHQSTQPPLSSGGGPSTSDGYDEFSRPSNGDSPVKVVGSTTCTCNISRKRKLDETDHCAIPAEVLGHQSMSNKDLISSISFSLIKLSCLTPELLTRFERSLKVSQKKSKQVKKYKQKVADKDDEIRQLKEEVEKLKKYNKITKKNEPTVSKVNHQTEVSALKTRLQDVESQLEYKDRLLVERATELDSVKALLVAERDNCLIKEKTLDEKYKQKVADKDKEICQLKEEVERYKKMAKYYEATTSKVMHQREMSILKTRLQDVEAQLEYKDQLLVEGVNELDSLDELLASERDRHSAEEKSWVKETEALKEPIRSVKSRVEKLKVHNRRLEKDRKWLISEGFAHVINNVHQSEGFLQPYIDFILYTYILGFQEGLKYGYDTSAKGIPIDELDIYRPNIKDKSMLAATWLHDVRYPYVEKLSSMVDQPLSVIRALQPERNFASNGSDTGVGKKDCVNLVDEFLKKL